MRVTLLTHYYEPEVGAPQRRWAAFVPRLVAAGLDVTVVTTVPHYPVGRAAPGAPGPGRGVGRHGETVVRVRYLPYDGARGRRALDQLRVALASVAPAVRSRPDVVVATVPGLPTLAAGRLVATLARARLVVEMRDAWPDLLDDAGTGPAAVRGVVRRVVTALQRSADAVVAVSERFAARLAARGVRRAVHVANGTDLALVPPLPRPDPPAAGEPLRVLYAGTVGESQAVHLAVRAVGLCPPGTVTLTVVGHGAALPLVHAERDRLPDPAAVTVLPPTDPDGVRSLLATHHTALVTLRDWPSFTATVPSKLYELLAVGRHVSAVVAGEAADVAVAAGGADVVAPEDPAALAALWQALHDDPTRLVVGEAPRRWVAAHADDPVLADRYRDLLRSLAGERSA
ncbi:glycosyltransferase [Aquipuribacter nitratireducens]|uniref:D-inositol 3-phosphate glycosyltransferase n=1 Tax=Aquipuribacter nitratireducens TaxID=650104 RepID=A0ABW0GI36_9MICO